MKDFSFFLLKNSLVAKMKKRFGFSSNGDSSTSTLNHQNKNDRPIPTRSPIHYSAFGDLSSPTLGEMIFQLENGGVKERRRMSCVDNSDILRSARKALNQYPRFSLDGKDSMYRSSFRDLPLARELEIRTRCLPPTLGGESVLWCKPGVVAKLMGLEAIPIPVNRNCGSERLSSMIKKQSLRRRAEINEKRLFMDIDDCSEVRRDVFGSCSTIQY